MNSLGLILLLSTLGAISAAFAQNCPLKFTQVLPRNSDYKKACDSSFDISGNYDFLYPCIHHVYGSLRSANVISDPYYLGDKPDIVVENGFLTNFAFPKLANSSFIDYTEAGLGLLYEPNFGGNCYYLGWNVTSELGRSWKLRATRNDDTELFDTSKMSNGKKKLCDRYIELRLEKL